MVNKQPEALRLADSISRMDTFTDYQREELNKAAAMLRKLYVHNTELETNLIKKSIAIQKIWKERDELRHLHAENDKLKTALRRVIRTYMVADDAWDHDAELERLYQREMKI